jgi:RNA polymerase sigma factor (TIGR02999 family)
MAEDDRPITEMLRLLGQGDREGLDRLVELLYTTLLRMCRGHLGRLPRGSLTTTDLLEELYLYLAKRSPDLANRGKFFAYAHEAMKHLALDSLRRERAKKRGGHLKPVPLDGVELADERPDQGLVEIFEVLERVEAQDPRFAEMIKLRIFDGLSDRKAAEELQMSRYEYKKEWNLALRLVTHLLGIDRRKTDGAV